MCRKSTLLITLVLVLCSVVNAQTSLVGHWAFEGNFNDSSGNGNHATAHGNAAIVNDPERGQVAVLDGNGDYMEIPHSSSLNITGVQISLAAWVYFDDVSGSPEIIIAKVFNNTTHTNPYFSYGLHILTNGQPRFWLSLAGGTANVPAPTGQFFESKRWYHLAGVYEGSTMTLYVNGQSVATTSRSAAINGYNTVLRLGTNGGLTEQMSGKLDDVRIYSRAMSAQQVRDLFGGTAPTWAQARDPVPADGAIHEDTWVNLSWSPGDNAASHDVHFGESFEDVDSGVAETFGGNQTSTFFLVGFPGFPYSDGLVPGTRYYWRIDEVEADGVTKHKGKVWSFFIPPKTAYDPDPADGAEFVDTDVTLKWTPGLGAKLHTVYLGDDFDAVSNATVGVPAGMATYRPGPLQLEKVYYWRVDEFDGIATYGGDIWAFTTPGAAGNPQPSNGAADVQRTQILTWTPATNATSHQIYFGTDKDAVRSATTASPEYKGSKALGDETLDPGKLAWHTSYYWRVDAVYSTGTVKGLVWSFTTADFITVDDFESYNDIDPPDPESNRIFDAWIDGFGTTDNGALVGNDMPPYAERTVVHGGAQSMPYRYDNANKISEATTTLVYPRDWTEEGVGQLSLWFRGSAANAPEQMFVALNGSAVVYHTDAKATQTAVWTQWVIDLPAFQGVNLTNVNTIAIGFGTKGSPAAGGSGKMYFDDVRLYRSRTP